MSSRKKRDYLVFVRAGTTSLHHDWMKGPEERSWDLQVSQWLDDPEIGADSDLPISIDKGTKWDSVYRYLTANPELMDQYRYIAFMDDDVTFTTATLNRYFEICEENELLVAQPSLHPDSYFCYSILLNCAATKLRYTNFVECMATAIRTDYLKSFLPRMARIKSGWGMDKIWTVTMPDPAFKSAIIDEISMVHTRPHAGSSVYKSFADAGLTPSKEMAAIIGNYRNIPDKMLVYGAIDRAGNVLGTSSAQMVNGLMLLANFWRYRHKRCALRTGFGMLVRAVTQSHYRPQAAELLSDASQLAPATQGQNDDALVGHLQLAQMHASQFQTESAQ